MSEENIQDKISREMADAFELATTKFEQFYKEAKEKGSKAASSGDYSTAASSGDYSTAASSGNYSKAASSGDYSTAASSGDSSTAASSGNYSKAASSGDSSTAASSGYYSTAASSGYGSTAASSGDGSKAASSGYGSKAASSGEHAACSALGYRAAVRGDLGNLLMASEYVIHDGKYVPIGGLAALVDGKVLKPQRWYIVEGGAWVPVDYTDGVFSHVLSEKGGVKKVKTDDGKVLYIVHDDQGNVAHGASIKEARADLIYKIVAKFDGELPKKATGKEWIGIYRAVTGACAAGVREFVERNELDMEATYTAKQVGKLTQGAYNAEKFAAKQQYEARESKRTPEPPKGVALGLMVGRAEEGNLARELAMSDDGPAKGGSAA